MVEGKEMKVFKNLSATIVVFMMIFAITFVYVELFPEWAKNVVSIIIFTYLGTIVYRIIAERG